MKNCNNNLQTYRSLAIRLLLELDKSQSSDDTRRAPSCRSRLSHALWHHSVQSRYVYKQNCQAVGYPRGDQQQRQAASGGQFIKNNRRPLKLNRLSVFVQSDWRVKLSRSTITKNLTTHWNPMTMTLLAAACIRQLLNVDENQRPADRIDISHSSLSNNRQL